MVSRQHRFNLLRQSEHRLRPLTVRAIRRLSARTVQQEADLVEQLASATTRYEPAAIALQGEWDRVVDLSPGLEPAQVAAHFRPRDVRHPATVAYRLRDALIADGCLYTRMAGIELDHRRRRALVRERLSRADEAQLCTDQMISRFFGDWLMTGLPLELLAIDRQLPPVVIPTGPWPHEPQYRAALAMPAPVPVTLPTWYDKLWLVDDRHMNEARRARYALLRERLRGGRVAGPVKDKVFLDRGVSGALRAMSNEREVRALLDRLGFIIVTPETCSAEEIVEILARARLCIGVEGSALTHAALAMPSGGVILALQPPRRFSDSIKLFCDAADLRFAYVVGDDEGATFHVNLIRLQATIEAAEVAVA